MRSAIKAQIIASLAMTSFTERDHYTGLLYQAIINNNTHALQTFSETHRKLSFL